ATSATVAPPGPKPVDVFTNSAAAALARVHAVTFSSSVRSAASMMTLLNAPNSRQGIVTASMSVSTTRRSPDLSAPTLITMSISRAPSKIARRVSHPFTSAPPAPPRPAQGKADDRAHADAAPGEQPGRRCHPRRVDADRRELELRRLAAQ